MLRETNGWGFIKPDDLSEPDCFFHLSGLTEGVTFDTLRVGMKVNFEITETPRGPNAVHITTTKEII